MQPLMSSGCLSQNFSDHVRDVLRLKREYEGRPEAVSHLCGGARGVSGLSRTTVTTIIWVLSITCLKASKRSAKSTTEEKEKGGSER